MQHNRIDFAALHRQALPYLPAIPVNTATPTSIPAAQPGVSIQFQQKERVNKTETPKTHETPSMQSLPDECQERFEERAAIIEFDGDGNGA